MENQIKNWEWLAVIMPKLLCCIKECHPMPGHQVKIPSIKRFKTTNGNILAYSTAFCTQQKGSNLTHILPQVGWLEYFYSLDLKVKRRVRKAIAYVGD